MVRICSKCRKEEIDSTKSDLEEVAKPIMQKLYASAGGAEGLEECTRRNARYEWNANGGMPDMSNMPEMNPTVEEVEFQYTKWIP